MTNVIFFNYIKRFIIALLLIYFFLFIIIFFSFEFASVFRMFALSGFSCEDASFLFFCSYFALRCAWPRCVCVRVSCHRCYCVVADRCWLMATSAVHRQRQQKPAAGSRQQRRRLPATYLSQVIS